MIIVFILIIFSVLIWKLFNRPIHRGCRHTIAAPFSYQSTKEMRGKEGEELVHYELMGLPDEYHIIDNACFGNNGKYVQIDHIVISPYAIFVIETKNFKGKIYGGEYSQYWGQKLWRKYYKFYNPIRQNEGHVRYLKYLLKDYSNNVFIPFIPIVVFNNEVDLAINTYNHIVVKRYNLTNVIKQNKTPTISENIRQKIIERIELNITEDITEQIQYSRKRKIEEYEKIMY